MGIQHVLSNPTLKYSYQQVYMGKDLNIRVVVGGGQGLLEDPEWVVGSHLGCLGASRLPPTRPGGVLEPEEYSFGR